MASNDENRQQCVTDQTKAFELLIQIPTLINEMKEIPALKEQVESLTSRIDKLDQMALVVTELKTDFDKFKDHIEESVITPFEKISGIWDKVVKRAPWVIVLALLTGADWDNLPKILSFIANAIKLVGG